MASVLCGDATSVSLFLTLRADVNAANKPGITAMHLAAGCGGELQIAKRIIEARGDVNKQCVVSTVSLRLIHLGCRALVRRGSRQCLAVETAYVSLATPLHFAAKGGCLVQARELLGRRADLTLVNTQGLTALDLMRKTFVIHSPLMLEDVLVSGRSDKAVLELTNQNLYNEIVPFDGGGGTSSPSK